MPGFQYWFAGDVAPVVLQFLLTATLGIIAFYAGVPRWIVASAVVLMVLVGGWTWYSSAEKANLQDIQRAVVAETINTLVTLTRSPVSSQAEFDDFKTTAEAAVEHEQAAMLAVFPEGIVLAVFSNDTNAIRLTSAFDDHHNSMLLNLFGYIAHLRQLSYSLS